MSKKKEPADQTAAELTQTKEDLAKVREELFRAKGELKQTQTALAKTNETMDSMRAAWIRLKDPEETLGLTLAALFSKDGVVRVSDVRTPLGFGVVDRALKKLHFRGRGRYDGHTLNLNPNAFDFK